MRENTDQKNSEHGPFLRSAKQKRYVKYNMQICNFVLLLNKLLIQVNIYESKRKQEYKNAIL